MKSKIVMIRNNTTFLICIIWNFEGLMEMIQVKQEPDESIQCFMCSESFEDNTHLEEHKKSLCCIKVGLSFFIFMLIYLAN